MIHPTRTSRRGFLKIGSLGVGGLSLSELLRDEAKAGIRSSTKSVIFIYLVGGPPHQDMFDLKPNAPAEIRGPWKPIPTNVPGIEINSPSFAPSLATRSITMPCRSLTDATRSSQNPVETGLSSARLSQSCRAMWNPLYQASSASVILAPTRLTTNQAQVF